jgi:hypothetical protein
MRAPGIYLIAGSRLSLIALPPAGGGGGPRRNAGGLGTSETLGLALESTRLEFSSMRRGTGQMIFSPWGSRIGRRAPQFKGSEKNWFSLQCWPRAYVTREWLPASETAASASCDSFCPGEWTGVASCGPPTRGRTGAGEVWSSRNLGLAGRGLFCLALAGEQRLRAGALPTPDPPKVAFAFGPWFGLSRAFCEVRGGLLHLMIIFASARARGSVWLPLAG